MSRAGFVPREKHPPPRDPHVSPGPGGAAEAEHRNPTGTAPTTAVRHVVLCTVDHEVIVLSHKVHHLCFFFLTKNHERCTPILGVLLKKVTRKAQCSLV